MALSYKIINFFLLFSYLSFGLTPAAQTFSASQGSVGLNPRQVSGITGWWDFSGSACSGNATVSSKFSSLADCTGNGNTATNGTAANRFTVQTAAQNGLTMGGSTHGTSGGIYATFTLAATLTDHTIFIVSGPTQNTQTANDALVASQSGNAGACAPEVSNANPYQLCTYVNNHAEQANTGQGSYPSLLYTIAWYRYNSSTPAGNWYFSNLPVAGHGVLVGTSSQGGQTYPNSSAISLGNTGSNVMTGNIGEVIIYNTDIGDAAAQQVGLWLENKWNIRPVVASTNPALGTKIGWWDFSGVSSTVSVTGGKVTSTTDATGYSGSLAQATGALQGTQNVADQNGLNTLTYSTNASAVYYLTPNLSFQDVTSQTWFWVIKFNTIVGTDQIGGSHSARPACLGFETGSNATHTQLETFWDHIGAFSRTGAGTINTGAWHIISYVYTANVNGSAASGQWLIDNVAQGAATTQKYGFISGNEPVIIGSDVAGVNSLQATMGEVEWYIGALGTTDETAEYNRLKTKWGL